VAVRPSEIEGLGVFALRLIRAEEVILEIDDSRIVDDEYPLRLGEDDRHCDYLADGRVVLMGVPERHINHSCDPNSFVRTMDHVRVVAARRNVRPGEEITNDYAINAAGGEPWCCRCGAERCRGGETWADYFTLPRPLQQEYRPLLDDGFVREHRERLKGLGL
jgi:hypothetical protein